MNQVTKNSELISAISDLNEKAALKIIRKLLAAKADPNVLISECQEGMHKVGERYAKREYFLTGLIMGGEIFREVMELIRPHMKNQSIKITAGKFLIGTVSGDIHDLGKDIVKELLSCYNFDVCDLGVDVPASEFVKKAKEYNPDVIGLSGLITLAHDSMRDTVKALHRAKCKAPVIIGGSQLDEDVFKYTGADYWTTDAKKGTELCIRLVSGQEPF
jgi:methanogenic corrinoid protein MtbC1